MLQAQASRQWKLPAACCPPRCVQGVATAPAWQLAGFGGDRMLREVREVEVGWGGSLLPGQCVLHGDQGAPIQGGALEVSPHVSAVWVTPTPPVAELPPINLSRRVFHQRRCSTHFHGGDS